MSQFVVTTSSKWVTTLLSSIILSFVVVAFSGCATPQNRTSPLPKALEKQAFIPDIPEARYWGDQTPDGFERWKNLSDSELESRFSAIMNRPHNYLVVSGGGADGAFGAGLLVGLSAAGKRPEFQIVTGVSTGALIAPFAFLGSEYDPQLKEIYTSYSSKDLIEVRSILSIISGDAAADTVRLKTLIKKYINDQMIEKIAIEGRKGRSLLVGTTNLDATRPVTWDITKIAASGSPNAKELIHKVILASASIPGAFPPVLIDVNVGTRVYQEVHVDGGVTSQLFLSAPGLNWKLIAQRLKVEGTPQIYVIRNSKLTPEWDNVGLSLVPILSKSISSLIRTQGIGDLAKVYILSQRDGIGFNLSWIPMDFNEKPNDFFDREYMKKLFSLGYERALNGNAWQHQVAVNHLDLPEK
ncbi:MULTISPECIES: patatin-like phospholipase family protein [Chitinibacter]|uniref:patatin-like phospholipase family protein n=1 Tax=Chitinibacter TaxID=230666 RepID=UPI0003FDFE1C|nr:MULTISPECIES: patatin-like phospholipase family protein [Chitinibacter]